MLAVLGICAGLRYSCSASALRFDASGIATLPNMLESQRQTSECELRDGANLGASQATWSAYYLLKACNEPTTNACDTHYTPLLRHLS